MWIVLGFAAKHKVLKRKSFPYILSFSDEPQKFSPSNDLMYTVYEYEMGYFKQSMCMVAVYAVMYIYL